MSEERMVESIASALTRLGVPEEVAAAGELQPRGHTGAMFAGGFVGDTPTHVCGFAAAQRRREAGALVFRVPRSPLDLKVHHVRVLELIDASTGARIELEGNRLPVTHGKGLIEALDG